MHARPIHSMSSPSPAPDEAGHTGQPAAAPVPSEIHDPERHDQERLGILQTFVAVAAGVGNNFFFKLLATLPVSEIIALRSGSALLVLLPLLAWRGRRRPLRPAPFTRAALARAACEATATACLIFAVTRMPLALVTAVLMTIPIMTALIGRFVLQEATPAAAWIAIGFGLAGTLLLLRPGLDASPAGLAMVTISALAFALRDVLTRAMPRRYGPLRMTAMANAATLMLGLTLSLGSTLSLGGAWKPINISDIGILAAAVALYIASNVLIAQGIRNARLAITSPLRYTSVPLALVLDITVLGIMPDALALAGTALIIASGLAMPLLAARRR
ncbi:Drug/metabolite transporter (DMT)-like permease [Hyphomicrobiales bacterium]|nr:Drug/metabolite transporter (DMT)-like permease [Hyphomicrobiales bacterium]CAH1664798.1 Drug/metabolite transporter (DMT)-like permease [Hyphomicrobiales bacterium]